VKIEKCWEGTRAKRARIFQQRLLPNCVWDEPCAAVLCLVLTGDFHLKNFVSMEPIAHFGMSHERNQAALEGAKAAFDFSLGLWGRRDEMSDAKGPQCALELAPGKLGVSVHILAFLA